MASVDSVVLGQKWDYQSVRELGAKLYRELTPLAVRVEPSGEFRRRVGTVAELRMLVEPVVTLNLFGQLQSERDPIKAVIAGHVEITTERSDGWVGVVRAGELTGLRVLVGLVDVRSGAQWGVALIADTGPKAFVDMTARRLQERGITMLGPPHFTIDPARVEGREAAAIAGRTIAVEECDVFEFAGVAPVAPAARTHFRSDQFISSPALPIPGLRP